MLNKIFIVSGKLDKELKLKLMMSDITRVRFLPTFGGVAVMTSLTSSVESETACSEAETKLFTMGLPGLASTTTTGLVWATGLDDPMS